jgi:hypothetical protein
MSEETPSARSIDFEGDGATETTASTQPERAKAEADLNVG